MAQNYFAAATESFQTNLEFIEREGRRGSPEWHLANGLLQLGQGLRLEHEAREERRKGWYLGYTNGQAAAFAGRVAG